MPPTFALDRDNTRRFSRIKAVYISNSVKTDDILVFDALLKRDNFIEKIEMFGYITEGNGKQPIYIQYKGNKGFIYWGSDPKDIKSKEITTDINIFDKEIYVGQYITYSAINANNQREEYTYQITDIRNWNDHCQN